MQIIEEENEWINTGTGQKIQAQAVLKRVSRKNFEITYIAYLADVIDLLGGKQFQVFKYILEHRNSENMVLDTYHSIAQKTGISYKTVQRTVSQLRAIGLVKVRLGVIALTPKVCHFGDENREKWLLMKFQSVEDERQNLPTDEKDYTPATPATTPDPFPYVTGKIANE